MLVPLLRTKLGCDLDAWSLCSRKGQSTSCQQAALLWILPAPASSRAQGRGRGQIHEGELIPQREHCEQLSFVHGKVNHDFLHLLISFYELFTSFLYLCFEALNVFHINLSEYIHICGGTQFDSKDSLVSYFWKRIPLHLKHTPRKGSQQVLPFNYCSFVSKDVVNENALKVRQKVVALPCGGGRLEWRSDPPFSAWEQLIEKPIAA